MGRKSLRALHWAESKHPRDDRGRFAHKGGGKWMARVAKDLQARFGDISMGAHPDHAPQGKLQSGPRPGHVLDIGGVRNAAKAAAATRQASDATEHAGRTGRSPTGTFVHGAKSATSSNKGVLPRAGELKPGDFATVRGTDQYGKVMKLTGHVQAASPVRMRKKGSKTAVERIAVQMAENPGGANGWRGTVYAHPSLAVEDHTPAASKPGSDSPTTRKPSEVARDVAGETPAALAHQTPGAGESRRGRTPSGALGGAPDASTNTSRREEIAAAEATAAATPARRDSFELGPKSRASSHAGGRTPSGARPAATEGDDLDGMTVVKSGGGQWAVRGNEADRQATSGYLYMSKTKADAEDWARTTAAQRRAMRAGNFDEASRLDKERTAALVGGEGRAYRPQGSVAMVPAAAAKERAAALAAPKPSAASLPKTRTGAKKGDLVLVKTTHRDFVIGKESTERTEYRYGVVGQVDKNGIVKTYSTNPDGSYPTPVRPGDQTYAANAEQVDVGAVMAAAQAHTYPNSTTPMPFDSFDEAKALAKAHVGDQREKLAAVKAAAPKGRDPLRLQAGDRIEYQGITAEVTGAPEAFENNLYDRGVRVPARNVDTGKEGFIRYKKSEKARVLPAAAPAAAAPEPSAVATDQAGITDPVDLARIRQAVEEHGGGYFGGPMGFGKGDATRYVTEGHLKELVAEHGHDTVAAAVAAEIARNPGALDLKPGSPEWKAVQAAKLEASQAASKQALAAVKAGNIDEAQRIIGEAELANPAYREGGFSWSDMRKYVAKQAPALPSRTNTGEAAVNADGGNVRTGRGPAGKVDTPRVSGDTGGVDKTPAERADALRNRAEYGPDYNRGVADALRAYDRTGDENFVLEAEAAANLPGARDRLTAERNASALKNVPPPIDYNATATSYQAAASSGPRPKTGGDLSRRAAAPNRALEETVRVENARQNFGKGEASKKPDIGRRPDGSYQYADYSKAGYDLGNLTVAEAALPDQGAVHSQYQEKLRQINGLQRQGAARVGSKDQYYRPMTRKLEEAAQYVNEHDGNPDTVAKLRALADIFRPQGDTAPKLRSGDEVRAEHAAMTAAREARTAAAAASEARVRSTKAYDKLLATEGAFAVQNPTMRKIIEQMEMHGWEITGHDPQMDVTTAQAPDGRVLKVQFISGKKPHINVSNTYNAPTVTFKAALAHVVTPTHKESGKPSIRAAMDSLGLPEINSSDHTMRPLEDMAREMQQSLGGSYTYTDREITPEVLDRVTKRLRTAAAANRLTADQKAEYNRGFMSGGGEDASTELMRQRADQFEGVADRLEQMDTERKAYLAERDRRAAAPLDIRPGRSAFEAKPKREKPQTAAELGIESGTPAPPKPSAADRKIASLEKKVETLQGRVGMAYDKRTSKGARIQSANESKARRQLEDARRELQVAQEERDTGNKRASGALVGATMAEVDAAMRDTPGSHRDNEAAWKAGIAAKLGLPSDNGEPHFKRDSIDVTGDQLKVGDFISDGASSGLGFQVAGIVRNDDGTLSVYGPGMMSRSHRWIAPNETLSAWRPGVSDANLAPLQPEEADLHLMARRMLEGYGPPGSPERLAAADRLRAGNASRAAEKAGVQAEVVAAAATARDVREPERPTGSREGVSTDVLERSLAKLRAGLETARARRRDSGGGNLQSGMEQTYQNQISDLERQLLERRGEQGVGDLSGLSVEQLKDRLKGGNLPLDQINAYAAELRSRAKGRTNTGTAAELGAGLGRGDDLARATARGPAPANAQMSLTPGGNVRKPGAPKQGDRVSIVRGVTRNGAEVNGDGEVIGTPRRESGVLGNVTVVPMRMDDGTEVEVHLRNGRSEIAVIPATREGRFAEGSRAIARQAMGPAEPPSRVAIGAPGSGFTEPPRVGRTPAGTTTGGSRVQNFLSGKTPTSRAASYKTLTPDEEAEAFRQNPTVALDAFIQTHFGRIGDPAWRGRMQGSRQFFVAPLNNLLTGQWTPQETADALRVRAAGFKDQEARQLFEKAARLLEGSTSGKA